MALAATASASLTETTYNKYNQTGPLSAATVVNPGSTYNGNYLFSVYINGNYDACNDGIYSVLRWTDENGTAQSIVVTGTGTGEFGAQGSNCTSSGPGIVNNFPLDFGQSGSNVNSSWTGIIRVLAGTNVTVEVDCYWGCSTGSPNYDLSVDAIGFW